MKHYEEDEGEKKLSGMMILLNIFRIKENELNPIFCLTLVKRVLVISSLPLYVLLNHTQM